MEKQIKSLIPIPKNKPDFDPKTHTYKFRGKVKPAVTDIIKAAGMCSDFAIDENAANFGTAFHKTVELLERDSLDEYDSAIEPWLNAYKAFKKDFQNLTLFVCEEPMYSPKFDYCGTADLIFHNRNDNTFTLLDIKTGAKQSYWALQTAAYYNLLIENFSWTMTEKNLKRWAIRIMPNSYSLENYENQGNDFNYFVSALNVYTWRKKYNLLNERQANHGEHLLD